VSTSITAPASRNAACPCGSGRRYKDCHGALGARAESARVAQPAASDLRERLHDALARQQAGDLAGAAARYEAVLAQEPGNFDALHMLGVVRLQQGELARARDLLERAVALEPTMAAAQVNLGLVRDAERLRAAEIDLCREVLPRLAPLCAPADATLDARAPADVLVADRALDLTLLARLVAGHRERAHVHRAPPFVAGSVARAAPPAIEWLDFDDAMVVMLGLDEPLALWGEPPPSRARMLVVTRDAPELVHDRLRELSAQGRERVHVCYADAALARAVGLPGTVLARGS